MNQCELPLTGSHYSLKTITPLLDSIGQQVVLDKGKEKGKDKGAVFL